MTAENINFFILERGRGGKSCLLYREERLEKKNYILNFKGRWMGMDLQKRDFECVVLVRRLDGQHQIINRQIFRKFWDMMSLVIIYYLMMLIKKSLYILHFKFVHFSLLLYRTLHLKEDNTIWKMARTIEPS